MIEITSSEDLQNILSRIVDIMIDGNSAERQLLTRYLAMHNSKIELEASDILKLLIRTCCARDAACELIELGHFDFVQNKFIPELETTTEQNKFRNKILTKKEEFGTKQDIFQILELYRVENKGHSHYEFNLSVPKQIREYIEQQPLDELISSLPRWKSFLTTNSVSSNCYSDIKLGICKWLLSRLHENWQHVTPDNFYILDFNNLWTNWGYSSSSYQKETKKYFNTMLIDFADHPIIQGNLPTHTQPTTIFEKITYIRAYLNRFINFPYFNEYEIKNQFFLNTDFTLNKKDLHDLEFELSNGRSHWHYPYKSLERINEISTKIKKYMTQNKSFVQFMSLIGIVIV